MKYKVVSLFILLLLLGMLAPASLTQAADVAPPDVPTPVPGEFVSVEFDPTYSSWHVDAPPGVLVGQPRRADALAIVVNYNPTVSCPSEHPDNSAWVRMTWPAEAQTTMNLAAAIWSTLLNGSQTVAIDACWYSTLGTSTLGRAKPTWEYPNFRNAPQADTLYAVALANQIANSDLNGSSQSEIQAEFSNSFSWHYGADGIVKPSEADFLTTALHEIGHGLGFLGTAQWDNGTGAMECDGVEGNGCLFDPPNIYDRFTMDGSIHIDDFASPSSRLGAVLIRGNLFFNAPNANAANGNRPTRIFSPPAWRAGSSYSHLDETTFNETANALMTPDLNAGESVHHPGPVALGMMADMGWPVNSHSQVYVDGSHNGPELGTIVDPYNTVREGAAAVNSGGTVWIVSGSYLDQVTISRPMFLKTTGGTVYIGK